MKNIFGGIIIIIIIIINIIIIIIIIIIIVIIIPSILCFYIKLNSYLCLGSRAERKILLLLLLLCFKLVQF